MRKSRHIDISSRLEATKQLGLVEDYRIDWPEKSLCAPHITVVGRQTFPAQVTKNYVAMLLGHLVPTREIVVTRNH
jgi:hypothetical protein